VSHQVQRHANGIPFNCITSTQVMNSINILHAKRSHDIRVHCTNRSPHHVRSDAWLTP